MKYSGNGIKSWQADRESFTLAGSHWHVKDEQFVFQIGVSPCQHIIHHQPHHNHRIMKCCHQHKKSAGNGNNVLHFTIGLSGVDLFLFFLLFHMYHNHFHLLPIHSITSYYLHPTSIHALFIFLLFLLLIDKIILKKMTFFCW